MSGVASAQFLFAGLRLDVRKHRLWRGAETIELNRSEYLLLRALVQHRGEVVSRRKLMQAVWGTTITSTGALDALVDDARRKLGGDAAASIVLISGVGYIMEAEP